MIRLLYVHVILNEIFELVNYEPFAGVSVIAIVDFFQLTPIGGKLVYAISTNTVQNFDAQLKLFKVFELIEVMQE